MNNNNNTTININNTTTKMKTSNVISPSNSTTLRNAAYSTTTSITGGMHRSGSNRSLFLRETSTSMKLTNSISSTRHRRHVRQPSNSNNTNSNNNEEDIESGRNLSIDYQEIQKRTLTKWVNAQLSTAGDHIENMETDLRDGKRLLKLLSVVVHKKEEEHLNTPKPERGNMRIHQLSNVAQALSFLESQFSVEVPDIGNEPIVNGDLKKTLVLISFIMFKYHIQLILDDKSIMSFIEHDNELLVSPSPSTSKTAPSSPLPSSSSTQHQKESLLSSAAQRVVRNNNNNNNLVAGEKGTSSATEAKLALLRWVRIQLHDYVMANIIPSIQDFSRSWRNGVAFCLLIHRYDPSLIPELFNQYLRTASEWNKQTWHELLTTAFDIAANQMNIPHYLEPEDLTDVDYPHEPSVMMYVTEFYKVMSNAQNMQSQEENDMAKKQRAVIISDLLKFLGIHHQNDVGPFIEEQNENQEGQPATPKTSRLIVEDYDKQEEEVDDDDDDDEEEEPTPLDTPSDDVSNSTNNPILDDILSDRDALVTFITSFSPAIEAMTKDEISSAEAVTQRMFAFEAIREQADGQHSLLESVNTKRQNLHHMNELKQLDEENDDVPTLRDEQQQIQAEATMIYNDLEHQWTDFVGLMDTTADKLHTLLNDWKEGEEDAKRFQQRAALVEKEMITLRESLDNAYPTVVKKSGDGSDVVYPLQPLEEGSNEAAGKYEASMADVVSSTNTFDENSWKSFEQLARDLCAPALRIVSAHYTRLQQRHDNLIKSLSNSKTDCRRYKRGVSFADITRAVSEELEIVRKTLNDSTKSVTEDAIQDLEKRVDVAHSTIQAVREEYKDLLVVDNDITTSTPPMTEEDQQSSATNNEDDNDRWYYAAHLQKIQEKYEIVCDWVEQVRVWFIEAQRIRKWIAERIDIIEQRDGLMEDVDPLSIQLSYSDGKIKILYDEHQALREEIEKFDADDMTRLRTHVKTLTGVERDKDLSPADTSTIEITLTTLNMLNRLKELLGNRSFLLDMLMLRIQWENQFSDAVKWVATTDEEMNVFLHKSARWSDTSTTEGEESLTSSANNNTIEEVIQTLVYLERKIADFDQADYSHVLDAYQEMDELNHSSTGALPDHLEKRQEGFEKAFEDLMKRCAFCRKVVEQHLKVMEVVGQFRQIKDQGEKLRQAMMETNSASGNGSHRHHSNNNNSNTVVNLNEEEMYAENVQAFKEQSAYLITHFAAQVPYPDAPVMSTAIGMGDEQDNQLANESIKSTISAYGMSLALLADGLDQLLASRQYILSLHQRSKAAYDKMARLTAWMEERTRTLNKTKIDIFDKSNLSEMEEEEVTRIEKERDGIATRLAQIEHEDLATVLQEVQQLEDDIDTSNAVTIDRHSLVSSIEDLEESHQQLQLVLSQRAFDLDMVKRFMGWQGMWTKSNHLILTAGRKIWDLCIKKARYDPNREDVDKPSYANDSENTQAIQLLQDRVTEIGDKHISVLSDMHQQLVDKYTDMQLQMVRNYSNHSNLSSSNSSISDMTTLQFLTDKEAEVEQKYKDLQFLLTYTTELMTQRSIITEFLLRVQDAHRDGEKIRDAITKITRRIMEDQETHSVVESRAVAFRDTIDAIWRECGQSMPYPTYNGSGLLRSLQPTETANYNAQIKAQTKALLDRKMDELQGLRESIDQLLETYRQANHSKTLAGQYDDEAADLQAWINAQAAQLKQQHIDITTDNATFAATISDDLMQDLESKHGVLVNTLDEFETVRLKELHGKVAHLMESTTKADIKSVDISVPVRRLGEVMNHLEQLKDALADHRVTMEAASKRILWQKKLQLGRDQLEIMSEQLRTFHVNKNKWIAQDDFGHEHVKQLEATWDDLIQQKNTFTTDTLPAIEQSYDAFVDYFAKLARPMATPDHIEAWMESLNRATNRFEENLGAQSKELDLVRQRLLLDDQLQASLAWLQKHQSDVGQFIEDRARWTTASMSTTTSSTTTTTTTHDNKDSDKELRSAWSELNDHYIEHGDNVINQVMNDLAELREASSNAVTNMPLVSEALNTKVRYLDQLQKRIQLDLTFADGIVTQRNLMIGFLDRMAALEQSAEQIREEIATNTTANGSSAPAEGTNNEEAALHMFKQIQELKSQGQDMTNDVSIKMPYPSRREGSEELSSDTAVSTQQQLKDDAMNALVRDTIETKGKRLAGLMESMEQLLESKENISRRKMAMEAYRKEWEACMEWIETRKSQLSKALEHTEPPCNIPGLRDGISLTDSIQSTTQHTNENSMTTLKAAYEKCTRACTASDEVPVEQQAVADKAWADLIEETTRARGALLDALVPAEIQECAEKLLLAFKELESTIANAETLTVTDEQISQWQKQVDELESHDYEQLQKDVAKSTVASNNTNVKEQLDVVAESAVQVRTSITCLYDAVNMSRLQKTHSDNADVVQARLEEVTKLIHETQETYQHVTVDENMRQRYQQLVATHREALAQQDDCKEAYNDLVSYYRFINTQIDVDDTTRQRQESIDTQWKDLEGASQRLSQLVNDTAKCVESHETLNQIEIDLGTVKKDVDAFDVSKKDGVTVLDTAERHLQTIHQTLDEFADGIVKDDNERALLDRHTQIKENARKLDELIDNYQTMYLQQSILDSVKQQAKEIERNCTEQRTEVQKRTIPDIENSKAVDDFIESHSKTLTATRSKWNICHEEFAGGFADQCERLTKELNMSDKVVEDVRQPAMEAIKTLDDTIKEEHDHLELLKMYSKHNTLCSNVRDALDTLKSTLTSTSNSDGDETEKTILLSDMKQSIEESIQAVEEQASQVVNMTSKHPHDEQYATVSKAVYDRLQSLKDEYDQLNSMVVETVVRMEKKKKHRDVSSRLTETMRYVDKLKDRANSLQLSSSTDDKNMINVEREELREIEQEVEKIVSQKDLGGQDQTDDPDLKSQRTSLDQSISDLQNVLTTRRNEETALGNIGGFLRILDKLEKQAKLLQTAIDDAAPHHAAIVNNKFSKIDLQSLLRNLIASYKQYEPGMTQLVKKAKAEAEKYPGDTRVSERLTRALARCNKIKAAAAARERELQTCINQLDHDFFTKLAMAKTTSSTRRGGPSSNGGGHGPSGPSNSTASVKRSGNTLPPPLPSTGVPMTRRSSSQSSTASNTRRSRVPLRPSKTPIPSRSVSRTKYVADPKNELDMELGRIVNENIYRVKVKMVPGEVGKYWFGEINPRLVYCRILPSKLVMVRVGGGWVELSKFLRDHKLTEGSVRPNTDDAVSSTSSSGSSGASLSTSIPFQNATLTQHTTRCVSPSGRITVRGGGGNGSGNNGGLSATNSTDKVSTTWSTSSRRSSKTPVPRGGHLDGDKYIRVDEAGNQVTVKMTKAEDGAKMPIISRRRG
ncbi:hypothetical protein BDA99DRAFT_46494 [Phascolomyces articulosus]|uniref:Uncharacterized protein n=1 Tax=Phascolomyces articulosus TaxID=60185 RepID=A0AAD5PFB9_9FUNG|nr:hypothetical protein BDA99DRAFT_46494 [Phascolomyces articulosus]